MKLIFAVMANLNVYLYSMRKYLQLTTELERTSRRLLSSASPTGHGRNTKTLKRRFLKLFLAFLLLRMCLRHSRSQTAQQSYAWRPLFAWPEQLSAQLGVFHIAKECAPVVNYGGVGRILGDLTRAQGSHYSPSGRIFVVMPHYAFVANAQLIGKFTFTWSPRHVHSTVSMLQLGNVTHLLIGSPSVDTSLWQSMSTKDIYNTLHLRPDERDTYFSFAASELISNLSKFMKHTRVHVHGATNAPALMFLRKLQYSGRIIYTIHDYSSEPYIAYRGRVVSKFLQDDGTSCPLKPSALSFCEKYPRQSTSVRCFSRMRLKIRAHLFWLCADHVTTVSHGMVRDLLSVNSRIERSIVQLASERRFSIVKNWVSEDLWNQARSEISWEDPVRDKDSSKKKLLQLFSVYGHGDVSKVQDKCFVGWTGRFETNKGVHLLPQMLLAACELHCLLIISGFSTNLKNHKIFQHALREMIDARDCPFLVIDDLEVLRTHSTIIRASTDITVVPSGAEAFGLVAAEALAFASVPVVSSVGGLPEVVKVRDEMRIDDDSWIGFTFLYSHSSVEYTGHSLMNAIKHAIKKVKDSSERHELYRRLISSTPLLQGGKGEGSYTQYMRVYGDAI